MSMSWIRIAVTITIIGTSPALTPARAQSPVRGAPPAAAGLGPADLEDSQGAPPPFRRRCGRVDDFALPDDPTFRSTELEAAFPGASWKDLDDMTSNRRIGHSFTFLPAGIVGAELEVRMQPHADFSDNDTIALGLTAGGSFAVTIFIVDLPEAGGTWAGNPPTIFTLDLDDLPPAGTSILAQVAADRVLDVSVQDDTAVDYMKLKLWTSPPPAYLSGLPHAALGQANLGVDGAGTLVVSNIGSSGQDGVRIDSGETSFHRSRWTDLSAAPDGAVIEIEATAVGSDTPAASGRLEKSAGSWSLSADYSDVGQTQQTISVFLDGEMVGSVAGVNGQAVESAVPPIGSQTGALFGLIPSGGPGGTLCDFWETVQWYCSGIPNCGTSWVNVSPELLSCCTPPEGGIVATCGIPCYSSWDFGVATPLMIDGLVFAGDRLVFEPDDPEVVTDVRSVAIRAADLPSIGITGEAIEYQYLAVSGEGESTLEASAETFTASVEDPSAAGGFAVDLGRADSFAIRWDPLDPAAAAPIGAQIEASATGSLNGVPGQTLGHLQVTKVGAGAEGLEITADFLNIGSPTHRIQVFDAGLLVAEIAGHSGPVGSVSTWPRGIGKLGGSTECYVGEHPPDTLFTVDGGGIVGDEIRVLAEGSGAVDYKSGFSIQTAGLTEITFAGEPEIGAVPMFADGFESGDTSRWSSTFP